MILSVFIFILQMKKSKTMKNELHRVSGMWIQQCHVLKAWLFPWHMLGHDFPKGSLSKCPDPYMESPGFLEFLFMRYPVTSQEQVLVICLIPGDPNNFKNIHDLEAYLPSIPLIMGGVIKAESSYE